MERGRAEDAGLKRRLKEMGHGLYGKRRMGADNDFHFSRSADANQCNPLQLGINTLLKNKNQTAP
jgi:hypothetical protein